MRVLFFEKANFFENTNAVFENSNSAFEKLYFILGNAYFILKITILGKHEYRLLITRALEKHGFNY